MPAQKVLGSPRSNWASLRQPVNWGCRPAKARIATNVRF